MSDTVDEPLTEEPVEVEEQVVEEPEEPEEEPEEPEEEPEEPVASEAVEPEEPEASEAVEPGEPVASEAVEPEEPVASEAVEPEEEPEEPEEEPEEPEEEPEEELVASEAVEPEEPEASEAVEEPVAIEQVASDIREILTPISSNDELSSDLKKRLGYLTYFFNKVVEYDICRTSKKRKLYLILKQGYTGTVDTPDVLDDIEKKLELVKKYIQGDTISIKTYRYKLSEYTVDKSLLNDKTILEKIELLELICSKITKFIYSSMDQKSLIEELDLLC